MFVKQWTHPPMSVPTPRGLPRIARRAPSPPEEPPGVMYLLYGFVVRPKTWLNVSPHCAYICQKHGVVTRNPQRRGCLDSDLQGLWNIRADEWNSAGVVEDLDKNAVDLGDATYPACIACGYCM